jgi:hypothetical protein
MECCLFILAFYNSSYTLSVAILLVLVFSIQYYRKQFYINRTAPNALYQNLLPMALAIGCSIKVHPLCIVYLPIHLFCFNDDFLDQPRQKLRYYYNIFVYRVGLKRD